MSRRSREPRLPCCRGLRWPGLAALALALAAVPVAPEPVRATGHETADYRAADYETADYETADYGDRARVEWRQEPSGPRKLFDATVLRPLQFVQLVLSAVIFVPAYPVAWPFGAGYDVLELCITEPTDRLFRKPLGDL